MTEFFLCGKFTARIAGKDGEIIEFEGDQLKVDLDQKSGSHRVVVRMKGSAFDLLDENTRPGISFAHRPQRETKWQPGREFI